MGHVAHKGQLLVSVTYCAQMSNFIHTSVMKNERHIQNMDKWG